MISFDIVEDAAARERQEALPEVATVMMLLPASLSAPPEVAIFHVSSAEPAM